MNKPSGGRKTAILGLILFAGPFLGALATAFFMNEAFDELGARGAADPYTLDGTLTGAIWAAVISLLVGLIGFAMILIALLKLNNRDNWFFYNSIIMAGFWCLLTAPLGVFFGGVILVVFIKRKPEFFPPAVTDWDTELSGEQ